MLLMINDGYRISEACILFYEYFVSGHSDHETIMQANTHTTSDALQLHPSRRERCREYSQLQCMQVILAQAVL